MPKIIKKFEFKPARSGSKYPWDEWFAGKCLEISKGEDFPVDAEYMPAKIKTAARARYKVVQVSTRDAEGKKLENSVILQARDMNPDERTAEDQKRAEEKAERGAAREAEKAAATPATEEKAA